MKSIFWMFVCGDLAGMLVLLALVMAAEPGSKGRFAWDVTTYMFIAPGLVLGASILLFTLATSPVWRGTALLLAASDCG